jgi:hypothetical protein
VFEASVPPTPPRYGRTAKPMASCAPTRDAPHQRVREGRGRPGNPRTTIGSGRLPRVTSNRTCLAAFRGSRERGRRVPGRKPEPPTPVTRPRSPGRLRPRTPLEDPPRPRLIDVCKLTKKSVIRGFCSNLVRCCPRSCPVRPGGIRGLEFWLLTLSSCWLPKPDSNQRPSG